MQFSRSLRKVPLLHAGFPSKNQGLSGADDEEKIRFDPRLQVRDADRERVLSRQSARGRRGGQERKTDYAPVHQEAAVSGFAEEQHR